MFTAAGSSSTPLWRSVTSGKTGLLLLMSLIPTTTWAELLSGSGPPDALSSVAVMLRTYWGPLSLGGGLLLSWMMPTHKEQRSGPHHDHNVPLRRGHADK